MCVLRFASGMSFSTCSVTDLDPIPAYPYWMPGSLNKKTGVTGVTRNVHREIGSEDSILSYAWPAISVARIRREARLGVSRSNQV